MSRYKPIAEMNPEEQAAKRAKINARNKYNVDNNPELTAKRRLKKKEYKENLWWTNPAAWEKVKASKHASRKRGGTKD